MMKKCIIFIIEIVLIKKISSLLVKDKECSLLSPSHFGNSHIGEFLFKDTTIKEIVNFDDFDELNLNCSFEVVVYGLVFIPNKEVYLDNTFGFFELFYHLEFKYVNREICFVRIKGFNHKSTNKIMKYFYEFSFLIQNSKFDFYLNGTKITKDMCKLSNFKRGTNFFGAIMLLKIENNVYYSKKTCPYVFMNSKLSRLSLNYITNSLILKNQLEFVEVNQTNEFDLYNRDLFYLKIKLTFEQVTLKLINRFVFKYLKRLLISGVIESIQVDLFSHFKHLDFLFLNLDNLEDFLHKSDNSWMKYLNSAVNVDMNNSTEVKNNLHKAFTFEINSKYKLVNDALAFFQKSYLYPDEDFCLFQHFPHENLVYPVIISDDSLNCSCTIMWLIKFYDIYDENNIGLNYFTQYYDIFTNGFNDNYNNFMLKCYYYLNFEKRLLECNFKERLSNCNKSNYMNSKRNSISGQQILFDIKWVELVFFFFLKPTICFIGIVTNFLSILTLKQDLNNKKKDKRISDHILMNSVFNLVYCVLTLLKLVNTCIFNLSLFCSSLYTDESSQLFNIIVIRFLGNIIKLCCNVSFISFSLSRFSLSTNNNNKFLKKLDEINLNFYYSITIIVCTLLSIFKLFQYQVNDVFNSLKSYPFEKYDIGECFFNIFYCHLFRYLNLINQFIKDIFFFVVNLIIDACLLRNSVKNFRTKIKIGSNKLNLNAAIKSKKKITRMFLMNGLLFIIAYTPEFITRILLLLFENDLYQFCNIYISCNDLNDIAEFFTFMSISFHFFIYRKFNNNFNEKFAILKNNIQKWVVIKRLVNFNKVR